MPRNHVRPIDTIEVDANDIAAGVRRDPWNCPIARGANRAFGMDEGCRYSDDGYGHFTLRRYEERYLVEGGFSFAIDFDCGEPVEPRSFHLLRLPDCEDDDTDIPRSGRIS